MRLTKGLVRALIFGILTIGVAFLLDAVMARAQAGGAKHSAPAAAAAHTSWSDFGGGTDSAQYSGVDADQSLEREGLAGGVDGADGRRGALLL